MATRLYPYNGSQNNDRNSLKLKIDCKNRLNSNPETQDWLELVSLFEHNSTNVKVYRALLDKNKTIVAKIGKINLEPEYEVGKKLTLPTFIKFNCIFSCLDNYINIKSTTKSICKKEGAPISIIIMPYISEKRIDLYKWERSNFNIMKNVMKHVCLSLFYSKKLLGFIHGDLHLGNILLKMTKRKEINYGEFGNLELLDLMPIIMDFDKSTFVENYDSYVYQDISNFITLMSNNCNVKFEIASLKSFLIKNITSKSTVNSNSSSILCNYIDNLEITYVSSEMPPLPDWLKPQKV